MAQPFLPEPLPAGATRIVVGTWRGIEPNMRCTRSIEQLGEAYFMVSRCPDIPGVDGTQGLPLRKVSDRIFKNKAGASYEIQDNGMLYMRADGRIDMRGTPQKELWPQ